MYVHVVHVHDSVVHVILQTLSATANGNTTSRPDLLQNEQLNSELQFIALHDVHVECGMKQVGLQVVMPILPTHSCIHIHVVHCHHYLTLITGSTCTCT